MKADCCSTPPLAVSQGDPVRASDAGEELLAPHFRVGVVPGQALVEVTSGQDWSQSGRFGQGGEDEVGVP